MMEDDIKIKTAENSSEFKTVLNNRYANYKSGKTKIITSAESKKRINRLLKSKGK